MILLCGATGLLGGRIAGLLAQRGAPSRVLLRPSADAAPLAALGAEIARGDLRDPRTLGDAVADAETVVTTVTAMSRLLAGGEKTTIAATDGRGTQNLIEAAERAGVRRFVYLSFAGLGPHQRFPLARAKLAAEKRLRLSPLREVLVRPDVFQEIWLSPVVGLDWPNGKLTVYGRGENPVPYVAVEDVAAVTVAATLSEDPPPVLEFGGPEALTRNDVVEQIRGALRRALRVRHVPRAALALGSLLLAPVKQELASVLGIAFDLDTASHAWNDRPLRELGIEPRAASRYIRETVGR